MRIEHLVHGEACVFYDDTNMDLSKIDNIEFGGVNHKDAPDYSDAYVLSADYNGVPMNANQLNDINENAQFVHDKLMDHLN